MKYKPLPSMLGIIPARGNSKGLPKKNVKLLCGKPLIQYTIESAQNSRYLSKTLVSSENQEILSLSSSLRIDSLKRPHHLSKDTVGLTDVITHVITSLELKNKFYDLICLLQPTSPLRVGTDIDGAFERLLTEKAQAVISGYEPSTPPLKAFIVKPNGYLKGIVNNQFPFTDRQQLPKTLLPNGAIFIIYTTVFKKTLSFLAKKTVPFIMPESRSIDIDTLQDFEEAESILNEHH